MPDLTIYLDVFPDVGLKRASNRNSLDLIESRSLEFFKRTRNAYLKNIKSDKKSIIINANVNINEVNKNITKKMLIWLKKNI